MKHSDVQTQLIDSFLAELEQLKSSNSIINFNNTSQLDALLSFLENSDVPDFAAIPSVNVVHVLLTLACQYPPTTRNHRPNNDEDGIEVSSSYMKEVDDKYDNALAKDSLQRRSVRILNRYVDIVQQRDDSTSNKLFANIEHALQPICSVSVHFGRPKLKQPEPIEEEPVVEVIQDSESDQEDIELIAEATGDLAAKYRSLNAPARNVISLSDIGSKTTGLGEATALFQNMPHLSATGTPEPEEQRSPTAPKAKKQKSESDPLEALLLFNDPLVANRLRDSRGYNIWELIKWAFSCCDNSSQYQKFLFDSSNTALHGIWEGYQQALSMMFRFLIVQHTRSLKSIRSSFLSNLLTQLGNRHDWYERLVEAVFTGLGQSSKEKPFPCYPRERSVIRNDTIASRPLCKGRRVEFDDNIKSICLRAQIIGAFLYQESDRFRKVELVGELSRKLLELDSSTIVTFLRRLGDLDFVPRSVLLKFILMLRNKLLVSIVGGEDVAYNLIGYSDSTADRIDKFQRLFESKELYEGVFEDSTYKTVEEFKEAWGLVVELVHEMVQFTITDEISRNAKLSEAFYERITSALQTFHKTTESYYEKFLSARSWEEVEADDDISFILEPEEISTLREQFYKEGSHDRLGKWMLMFRPLQTSK